MSLPRSTYIYPSTKKVVMGSKARFLFYYAVLIALATEVNAVRFARSVTKKIPQIACSVALYLNTIQPAFAGMLTFPLPAPLKNNIVLIRAGESFADAKHEVETNPVKKLRLDNALTFKGREEAIAASKKLDEIDFSPTYIWTSNTERAYETAAIIARETQLGQNRIVPEYSFLDARAMGTYEGKNDEEAQNELHSKDEELGVKYKPPANSDGTPSESISDVLVRDNQLVATIESMYSGENVVIIAPDSDVLSILQAALSDDNPDAALPKHARFSFKNGEVRKLIPLVKPPETLVTGQTKEEASATNRRMKALRAIGTSKVSKEGADTWFDIWRLRIDHQNS